MPDHPTDDIFEHGHPNPDSPLDEPLAESQAQDCDAKPEETDTHAVATEARFGDTEVSPRDEVAEQFPLEPLNAYIDQDGLPTIGDVQLSTAAPFDREHLVCLEDDREYIEVFSEDLHGVGYVLLGCPELLYRALKGLNEPTPGIAVLRSKWTNVGEAVECRRFNPEDVVERWGKKFVKVEDGNLLLVRPVRERCKNYMRQVMPNDDQPDENALGHRIYFRNCLARRSVGGALMTLRDEGVYACDYRDPPDAESVRIHLDERDRAAIERGTKGIEMVDLFNIKPKPKEAT